jgi:hypothetical protein
MFTGQEHVAEPSGRLTAILKSVLPDDLQEVDPPGALSS